MKRAAVFITSDGEIHMSKVDAVKHAENRYGLALTKLAHDALRQPKYLLMCDFIESRLQDFLELAALKQDAYEAPDEDDASDSEAEGAQ